MGTLFPLPPRGCNEIMEVESSAERGNRRLLCAHQALLAPCSRPVPTLTLAPGIISRGKRATLPCHPWSSLMPSLWLRTQLCGEVEALFFRSVSVLVQSIVQVSAPTSSIERPFCPWQPKASIPVPRSLSLCWWLLLELLRVRTWSGCLSSFSNHDSTAGYR